MGATARRHDLDIALVGEFRGCGEAAETLASHLAALQGRGLRIGLAWLRDPAMPPDTSVHPRLAALVRAHAAVPIPPDCDQVTARVALVYEPLLLRQAHAMPSGLHADIALMMVTGLAANVAEGVLGEVASRVDTALARRQLWCPASPALRARCRAIGAGLPLSTADIPPFEPVPSWRVPRALEPRRRPVLGRILRPDDARLPRDRAATLAAYPDCAEVEMRFLGGEAALAAAVQPLPAGWSLQAPDAVGVRRFLARLDCYVHQADPPGDAAPRGVLQAMAVGRVALVGPNLRAVLGPGPAYREPDHVMDTVRYLHAEPRFYARYIAEQDAALAERFDPEPLLALLAEHLRVARRRQSVPGPETRTVAFYPTNGVGLGHVTRLLAIARRLPPALEPVFFTPCHALSVIEHAGFRVEHVPDSADLETRPADHDAAMAARILAMLRYYEPAAIVFDGNVPRQALLAACADHDAPLIWVRRGMWRAEPTLARHLALSRRFDAVLEPREAAAAVDRGATAQAADGPLAVPPVMLLDRGELVDVRAARAVLGLSTERPAVLVQLGAGTNHDIDSLLDRIGAAQHRLGVQIVVAEWLIQQASVRRRGLRYLASFPNARYLRAFDLAVSAAGYNSFHELLHLGVPTLFVPNDHHKVDDQRARAEWAEARGAAICLPRGAEDALVGYLSALLDPALRRRLARRARTACPVNGAAAAAAAVTAIVGRG